MAGIFERVARLVRANVNDLLDRAEDPEKVARQMIADMSGQVVDVKRQVATAIAEEKRTRTRYERAQREVDEWQRRAELAIDKGDDALAREALARRNSQAKI